MRKILRGDSLLDAPPSTPGRGPWAHVSHFSHFLEPSYECENKIRRKFFLRAKKKGRNFSEAPTLDDQVLNDLFHSECSVKTDEALGKVTIKLN